MRAVGDLLAHDPARLAIRYGAARITYGDLQRDIARAAHGLHALGIRQGDRVGLWLPNVPAWLVLFFACARLGAIAVSVNTRFRAHEVQDIVGRAGCRLLAVWPHFNGIDFDGILRAVEPAALTALERLIVYTEGEMTAAPPGFSAIGYDDLLAGGSAAGNGGGALDRCVIFTTSGTTRAPKFVCHVQHAVAHHARDTAAALGLSADARVLQALPLCGVFGFTQALAALGAAAPMIMLPLFDASTAAALVRSEGITHMNGVDDMIERMLASCSEPLPFPSLRHFGYAAFNPALDDIAPRAQARGVCMRGLYGMSECHAFFALQPLHLDVAERSKGGGMPVAPEAQIRIRDPADGRLLGPGEQGEIEIKGPSLMQGYFGDERATHAAFTDDGFLRTGDLGCLEGDGRFRYVARMGDVLRLGGFLTSPLEIEAVIDTHAAVSASQVVAVDYEGAPVPIAFVIAAAAHTVCEADVVAHCRARLAGYKLPRRVFTLNEFPTTSSANGTKIQKATLRTMALALMAAPVDPNPNQRGVDS